MKKPAPPKQPKMSLSNRPLPSKLRRGRKTAYAFWKIPKGGSAVFEGAEMKNIVSAAYQFKMTYGGDYTSRTLEDGSVLVYCLEAPHTKHPAQLEEEWLEQQQKKV